MDDQTKPAIPIRSVGKKHVNQTPTTETSPDVPNSLEAAIAQAGMDTLNQRIGQKDNTAESAPASKNGRSVSTIELYSLEAQWAFDGLPYDVNKPRQRGRPGWEVFRSKSRFIIVSASTKDDPYAIRTLIELDEQFKELLERHKQRIDQLEELLKVNQEDSGPRPGQGLRIVEVATARFDPKTYYITGSLNAYARVMADQISVFDRMVSLLLMSRDCGLINKKIVNSTTSEERRAFGRIFETALRFRPSGISRKDVANGLATVEEAYEKYGPIPVGILDGTISPVYVDIESVLDDDIEHQDSVAISAEAESGSSVNGSTASAATDSTKEDKPATELI